MISATPNPNANVIGTKWWTSVDATTKEIKDVLGEPRHEIYRRKEWWLDCLSWQNSLSDNCVERTTFIATLYRDLTPDDENEKVRWHIGAKDRLEAIELACWLNEQLTDRRKITQQKYKFADCDITFPDGTFQEHLIFKLNYDYVDEQEDDQVFYYADNYEHLLELCTEDSKETFRITTINKLYE